MSLPWYRWYAGDWLGSPTRLDMSAAERGVYRDLLDWHYVEGSIPADETKLRRRLAVTDEEFAAAWPGVSRKFEADPDNSDRLINRRAADVIAETEEFYRKQVENGKKGGRPKGKKNPTHNPNGTQPITQLQTQTEPKGKPNGKAKQNPTGKPNPNPKESQSLSQKTVTKNSIQKSWESDDAYRKRIESRR